MMANSLYKGKAKPIHNLKKEMYLFATLCEKMTNKAGRYILALAYCLLRKQQSTSPGWFSCNTQTYAQIKTFMRAIM